MSERTGSDRVWDSCNPVVTPNIKKIAGTWTVETWVERAAGKAVSLMSFPILMILPVHEVASPEAMLALE